MLLKTMLTFKSQLENCKVADQYLATCIKLDGDARPMQTPAQAKVTFARPEIPAICTTSFADISFSIHNIVCQASKLPPTGTVSVS